MSWTLLSLIFALLPVAPAEWRPSDCPAQLPRARAAEQAAEDRERRGQIGSAERANARLDELEIRFNCRELGFAEYCTQAEPLAHEAATDALHRTPRDADLLLRAQLRNGRVGEMCRPLGSGWGK